MKSGQDQDKTRTRPGQDQAGTSSSSNDTRSTFRPGATPRTYRVDNGESWPVMAIDDFDTYTSHPRSSMFSNEALVSSAPVMSTGVPASITPGTGFPVPGQPQILAGVGDDLGSSSAATTKEKIWWGEFIDIGALISPSMSDPSIDEWLTLTFSPASANFQLRAPNRKTVITGIHQWTSAMLVFVSVYAERNAL
eukprot:XP_011667170.1 PREDICTED: uncharacterized protein LOC105439650 [Strongylocentrotus purpuratus]